MGGPLVAQGTGMRATTRLALTAVVLASAVSGAVGCSGNKCGSAALEASGSSESDPAPSYNAGAAAPTDATRLVSEADIVQLDHEQNRVYAMSKSGTLAVVDASQPGTLTLLGKSSLSGEPFEMYRRGSVLLTMSNHGVSPTGQVVAPVPEGSAVPAPTADAGALIAAVDVKDPANARTLATFKVPGEIADSRVVGNVLYLATYENVTCYGCGKEPRTLVTTFDIAEPTAPKQIDQVTFASPGGGFNAAWSTPWKRSIIATKDRLYVGGLSSTQTTTADEGVIEVLDISDPTGHLVRGAKITTSGPVMSRWQMDEHEGVFRVFSQRGAGRTQNGEKYPDIDTFRIESTASMLRLGHTTMTLPRQEGLKTVRFDGARAYAITFNQTDPLFTIDLSDAANPVQKGELHIPGWMYHLEPRGDRVLGLGLDRTDKSGNLNVSLFDVSDLTAPKLVQRVSFGPTNMYEDYQITNEVLAEDQDRIQKAFRVFEDGLIAIPYSRGDSYASNGCDAQTGGVQLVDWTKTSLTRRALLPVKGNARRAIRRDGPASQELIAVSDSNISSFAIEQRDVVKPTADVVIGTCVPRTTPGSTGFMPGGGNPGYYHGDGDSRQSNSGVWSLCR
jgi:hypothetical protein